MAHASTNLQTQQQHSQAAIVLRTLSKESQSKWIERVFAKLLSIYGDRFSANWAHTDINEVKETWADALGGFDAETIGKAIKACYDEQHPPKLPDFVALCRRFCKKHYIADELPISTNQAKSILAEANKRAGLKETKQDFKLWAKKLKDRYLHGEILLQVQINSASEALGEIWENHKCEPRKVIE